VPTRILRTVRRLHHVDEFVVPDLVEVIGK
jgi:hypothetical protein